ncbi:l-asparaginase ii [Colletotrichum sojae]|uniref:L-asparaginase ii n=1 Tax=Colletotrichum sojae TaxID=2175907 RepID=A0A8H6IY81_9PEZI|nr:l-asparaginase ii [Colletotrichum sojae]
MMTKTTYLSDFVITDRGGVVENRHAVHAAVVDADGKLLYAVGDPSRITLARSAAKPAQALAVLETPGFGRFGFDDADLALMCASHSSEERHIERARSMLARVGATESDLRCGGHPSINPDITRAWIKADVEPTAVYNNCSAARSRWVAVKKVVEGLSGLDEAEVRWAIDGCNLTAPGLPLSSMGRIFAAFARAADEAQREESSAPERTRHMARIFNAMFGHSEMVGGEGRFCTLLMEAYGGTLMGKVGADGFYGVGIRASEDTERLGSEGAVGIAVKIEDGSLEILYAVVAELLEQLQIGNSDTRSRLASFHHPKRLNTAGVETGRVSLDFKVRAVG